MKCVLLSAAATIVVSCGSGDLELRLGTAVGKGDLQEAEALLGQGADIDHRFPESDGYTILMAASSAGETSGGVKFLLDHGARVDERDSGGKSALDLARMGGHTETQRVLEAAAGGVLI